MGNRLGEIRINIHYRNGLGIGFPSDVGKILLLGKAAAVNAPQNTYEISVEFQACRW